MEIPVEDRSFLLIFLGILHFHGINNNDKFEKFMHWAFGDEWRQAFIVPVKEWPMMLASRGIYTDSSLPSEKWLLDVVKQYKEQEAKDEDL